MTDLLITLLINIILSNLTRLEIIKFQVYQKMIKVLIKVNKIKILFIRILSKAAIIIQIIRTKHHHTQKIFVL